MKKLILAAIITFAITGGLSAQTKNSNRNTNPGTNKDCPAYIDENKNGVCDNYENNPGQCTYRGQRQGQGRKAGYCQANGQGRMTMQSRRAGNGRGRS